ncbi:MAG: hypothetical protein CBC35_07445 [Planctomycetes bacterium TMED75]|nr:hypothetical protein [Planctomycetaceae bacterium]OUU92331.1 MAG: hypothetical protein CBC35_07445 [Planctomycetes bacterium TMED75]
MSDEKLQIKKIFAVTPLRHEGDGARSRCWCVSTKDNEILLLKHVRVEDEKDERWIEQLDNEHQISVAVEHPNIRKSCEVIYHPSKRSPTDVGLLLQYVDGMDLQEWQSRTNPSLEDLVAIFIKVSDALNHMHISGYAHADMKPLNVLIDNRSGEPLLIDLGQACPLMMVKERIQGTPGFMAPEQAKRNAVTYLTDVFNWGATMYFMLSGQRVDTEKWAEPEPLRNVPADLSDLIAQCLRMQSDLRPSMKFVRDSLRLIHSKLDVNAV